MKPESQKLPSEINEQIVNYLPSNDRVTCLTVCKSWHAQLYHTIVRVITITSRRQIKCLISQMQKYNDIGNSIRELYFKKRVGLTPFEFTFICQHCPSLEVFKFTNWRNYKPDNFTRLAHLKQISKLYDEKKGFYALVTTGHTLTHLELSELLLRKLVPVRMHLHILQYTPNLTHLTLDGEFSVDPDQHDPRRLMFNYVDWVLLHTHCKQLTSIRMSSVSLNATQVEAEEMEGANDVFPNMKRLVLKSLYFNNPAWLHYIAFIYPNMIELEVDFNVGCFYRLPEFTDRIDPRECQTGFMLLAHQLTKLKRMNLRGLQKSHFSGSVFFGMMEQRGVQLEEVHIAYSTNSYSPPGIDVHTYNALVNGQRKSLRTLDVDIWRIEPYESFNSVIEPLSLCTRLTELYLSSDDFTAHYYKCIPIDLILNECPGITTLSLARFSVDVDDKHSMKKPHSLRKLLLSISKVSQSLFDYLSVRCFKIRHLELYTCVWMPMEIEMMICMPKNEFEVIHITDMNSLGTAALEGNLVQGHAVNLFRVSRLDAIEKLKERNMKHKSSEFTLFDPELLSTWYHLYKNPTGERTFPPSEIRKLGHREKVQCSYSISVITERRDICKPRHFREFENHYVHKKQWKKDIGSGYLHIICKSLNKIKFNYNSVTFK